MGGTPPKQGPSYAGDPGRSGRAWALRFDSWAFGTWLICRPGLILAVVHMAFNDSISKAVAVWSVSG